MTNYILFGLLFGIVLPIGINITFFALIYILSFFKALF